MKDFARIVRGSQGDQVVVYIEYSEQDCTYFLCAMVGYPTPTDNYCRLESGCIEEMELMLQRFDCLQADAVLLRFEAERRRLAVLIEAAQRQRGDNVRRLHT